MNLDIFMREAVKYSANKVFSKQEKEAKQAKEEMQQKLETNSSYKSNFEGIPKPSFFQQ